MEADHRGQRQKILPDNGKGTTIPGQLLIKHLLTLLYGQFYFFVVYKMPLQSLKGIGAFLRDLSRILQQRKALQTKKNISSASLDTMLSRDLFEPPLKEIIKNRLRQILKIW